MQRYSLFLLIGQALRGNRGWQPAPTLNICGALDRQHITNGNWKIVHTRLRPK